MNARASVHVHIRVRVHAHAHVHAHIRVIERSHVYSHFHSHSHSHTNSTASMPFHPFHPIHPFPPIPSRSPRWAHQTDYVKAEKVSLPSPLLNRYQVAASRVPLSKLYPSSEQSSSPNLNFPPTWSPSLQTKVPKQIPSSDLHL